MQSSVLMAVLLVGTPSLETRFAETVRPFLDAHCTGCHGAKAKAGVDLRGFTSVDGVAKDLRSWLLVLEQVREGQMPPEDAKRQPTPAERRAFVAWIEELRDREAKRNAGDPGIVLARRLSNAEYDNTIRDLTGVDLRPAREFPVDPANEAGFDNSGESLAMSPALVKKYLEAARRVADHLVIGPERLAFAPHPMIADTDRDKYNVNRIVAFYKRQPTDHADYFLAAWRYRHRAALGRPAATLAQLATEARLSAKYLSTIWTTVSGPRAKGPLAMVQAMWRALPPPARQQQPPEVRTACEALRDFVRRTREDARVAVPNLRVPGMNPGAQALVLWKNRQMAANRRRCTREEPGWKTFCSVFPDAFYVSERARVFLEDTDEDKDNVGRLLSAGFHNQMGYFRDDGPLYDLLLDEAGRRELDALWQELDFVSGVPMRMHAGLIWFERSESGFLRDPDFDFARAEDRDVTSEDKFRRFADVYTRKVRRVATDARVIAAVEEHFRLSNDAIRWVERARRAAEPAHLQALADLAARAYRRPLTDAERDELHAGYRRLRGAEGMSHDEAVRETVVGLLMSPHFLYRLDLQPVGEGIQPLSGHALASRLAYFLWASMPDRELLDAAAAGTLQRPETLVAQARRMLKDPRARGLVTEFAGHWLDFRRFEEHNAVDRERFPGFTNDLRQAMFEEPIRFIEDAVRNDRSVLELLFADHTFVNPVLARHYGIRGVREGGWRRVDGVEAQGRGGLLPMAVFLTRNAPGLRTSPVKRGYWVARNVLGERIPPPPAAVPELPADEAKLGQLTLREALAKHREDRACAGCHARFDSLGLVFEGYGPVGERRERDLGGRAVETRAVLPGATAEADGLAGLRAYVRQHRQADFVDNLTRKLFAYALGRSPIVSDEPTLTSMREKLAAQEHRFGALVELIVTSPQFVNRRGPQPLARR